MKRWLYITLLFVALVGCRRRTVVDTTAQDPVTDTTTIVDTVASDSVAVVDTVPVKKTVDTIDFSKVIKKVEQPPKKVYKNWVRIAVKEQVTSLSVFAYEKYRIRDGVRKITISPGVLSMVYKNGKATVGAHGKSASVNLPCTLAVLEGNPVWDIGEKGYRGEIILRPNKGRVMVVNHLPVESYLRGVLPLEIGVRSEVELEALKAQAVAARTYTYAKMLQRKEWKYDLLPTVADQVYGGTSVEAPLTDRAIDETANEVMGHKNALVEAFYHSTCGGRTANINEVWDTEPRSYLVSRADTKSDGTPWCSISKYATWQEQWSRRQFNEIVKKYSRSTKSVAPLEGSIQKLTIQSRTSSGRVKRCFIQTTNGSWNYGKDRIRFVFRRPNGARSILRSSHFRISLSKDAIFVQGRGFGHGIGMCQMGAIGRSRAGQSYRQILSAYYRGVSFLEINDLYDFTK